MLTSSNVRHVGDNRPQPLPLPSHPGSYSGGAAPSSAKVDAQIDLACAFRRWSKGTHRRSVRRQEAVIMCRTHQARSLFRQSLCKWAEHCSAQSALCYACRVLTETRARRLMLASLVVWAQEVARRNLAELQKVWSCCDHAFRQWHATAGRHDTWMRDFVRSKRIARGLYAFYLGTRVCANASLLKVLQATWKCRREFLLQRFGQAPELHSTWTRLLRLHRMLHASSSKTTMNLDLKPKSRIRLDRIMPPGYYQVRSRRQRSDTLKTDKERVVRACRNIKELNSIVV
jgi:hypothetical protein